MFFLGLKLFSINVNYVRPALDLYDRGLFQYIELYAYPGSYSDMVQVWQDVSIPFRIHAPHYKDGLNFAKRECEKTNMILASEALKFADALEAETVIFHPGVNGKIAETARQIKVLGDRRIIIENKPYYGKGENLICNGSSPEDILHIMSETGAGFCLDLGHAICSANARDYNPIEYIERFVELKPSIYHLTDGDYTGLYDRHDHYGEGSYPMERLAGMVPGGSFITNEAVKNSPDNLDDFVRDIDILRGLLKGD